MSEKIQARGISFTDQTLVVELEHERHSVPLEWIPELAQIPVNQLSDCQLSDDGTRVHWPESGLTLPVKGLLLGSYLQDGLELLEGLCDVESQHRSS